MPELDEGFLDAPGCGGCDALVDGQCLLQAGGAFAGVAVLEVAAAGAFQGQFPCVARQVARCLPDCEPTRAERALAP